MPDVSDMELLRDYNRQGSEDAFAELVRRHINLVYSTAYRHAGIAAHAEETTQAVFVILARKAAGLRPDTILDAWLYETARLTSLSFMRGERRRQLREQEAYMQSTIEESADVSVWNQLAPLLDEAMERLEKKDREVVVLRYFKRKSLGEVAATLQITEAAAQSRVHRAVEKLQKYFARRGIDSAADTIARTISTHSVQVAPALLAKTVTAIALAKGAAAGGSTLTLVKATLIAMKTKTIVATTAAAVVILGIGGYLIGTNLVHQPKAIPAPPSSATPSDTLPIKLANDGFKDPAGNLAAALLLGGNDNSGKFLNEVDPDTRRTTNSAPAGHIKCLVEPTSQGSADYLKSLPSAFAPGLAAARYINYFVNKDSSLFGKRIRVTGWMKTSDVRNWAGANLVVANMGGYIFAFDGTYDRPLHGTTGWQQVEFVTDVPKEPCFISLSPTLYGTGEMWCDDFQIDVVPSNTPTTDDRVWNVWSQDPNDYTETTDPSVIHNGHPALCIAYVSPDAPLKYSFVWWGQHNRNPEKFHRYLGHTVRMTVWAKSENIPGNAGLNFEPKGAGGQTLAQHSAFGRAQIRGTTDWAQHSVTCVIPEDTQDFQTAFFIFGSGKLWIDMGSLKFEIVK
jgi:RNA polymerase sigma factor (sigma-70 family)